MKVTVLGCGPSAGVPQIAASYPPGFLEDTRNHRTRSSVLVEHDDTAILVDTSPDLRQQLLRHDVRRLDAVCYSHAHADHCHGIDDLRRVCRTMDRAIPAFGDEATLAELRRRFGYVFVPPDPRYGWTAPQLLPRIVAGEPFDVGPIRVRPFTQDHVAMPTLGYRFDAGDRALAYSTDVKTLDDRAFEALAGLDLWIVDCLSLKENPIHSDLARTLGWIARAKPRHALLTHMGDDMAFAVVERLTPTGVGPAHDGLVVEL